MHAIQALVLSPLNKEPRRSDFPGHPSGAVLGTTFATRSELNAAGVHLPGDRDVAIQDSRGGSAAGAGFEIWMPPRVMSVVVYSDGRTLAGADGSQVVELWMPADNCARVEVRVYALCLPTDCPKTTPVVEGWTLPFLPPAAVS